MRLLIIADDFTGALDTGVQFTRRGAVTRVVTDPTYDFQQTDKEVEVLVLDAETRHLAPKEAYKVVFRAARGALDAGFTHIYKKTDSALRGNVGAELTAVLDAAGADRMAFLPAFPKMNRVTRNGIHYISGVPVAESVFGQDPFEPVRLSAVAEMIAEQSETPVVLHPLAEEPMDAPGIQVYDAESDGDLERIGRWLGKDGLRLSAGCAGFAAVLAEILELNGEAPRLPELVPSFFVSCGSVNLVTLRQMSEAEADGFPHIHLTPEQKLDPAWLESAACDIEVRNWLKIAACGRCILDVNDPAGCTATDDYAKTHGLTTEDLRVGISTQLGHLMKRLLDGGLDATILCTGGDTLLAMMRTLGVAELVPAGEVATGSVLTSFVYHKKVYYIISKSGGFGEPDLFCRLAKLIEAGKE